MSENNSNPHKTGDNDGSDSTETDVTIDANGSFAGGDFTVEEADDTGDENEASDEDVDDDVDEDESKSGFDKLNEGSDVESLDVDSISIDGDINNVVYCDALRPSNDVYDVVNDCDHVDDVSLRDSRHLVDKDTDTDNIGALHGVIVKQIVPESPSEDIILWVADNKGLVRVAVQRLLPCLQNDLVDMSEGDIVVINNLRRNNSENQIPLSTTNKSSICVISEGNDAGKLLERRSELANTADWYLDFDVSQGQARQNLISALLSEYHIESPYNSDDMYLYVDDSAAWKFDDGEKQRGTFIKNGAERIKEIVDSYLPAGVNTPSEKTQIVKGVRDKTRVAADAFKFGEPDEEERKWTVACENGVIDLRTGDLLDFSPEYRCTSKIPVQYDAGIDELGDEVDAFLDSIVKEEIDKELLLQAVAHSLPRTTPTKSFWMLIGPGDNGKSLYLRLLGSLLGDKQGGMTLKEMCGGESQFGSGAVVGKHLVVDDDATATKIHNVNKLKKLTGGNEAEINQKHKQRQSYQSYATIVAASNDPPLIGDQSDAAKSRLKPVVLPHRFTDDPNDDHKAARPESELVDALTDSDELQALLAVAVDYAQQMYRSGSLIEDRSEDENWGLYQHYSDSVMRFWSDCMQQDSGARVTKEAVYSTYVSWCEYDGAEPVSNKGRNNFWVLSAESHETNYKGGVYVGGKTAIEHMTFNRDALEHAPQWVVEEWGDEIDGDTETIANNLDRVTPIADLNTGYCTTQGRVMSRDAFDADATTGVKLMIEDETTAIDVVAYGDAADKLDGVYSGDEILIKRATLGQNKRGVPQITVSNATEIEVVDAGIDVASDEDVDDDDGSDDDGDEDDGVVDGGVVADAAEEIDELLDESEKHYVTRGLIANRLSKEGVVGSDMEAMACITSLVQSDEHGYRRVEDNCIAPVDGGDSA